MHICIYIYIYEYMTDLWKTRGETKAIQMS